MSLRERVATRLRREGALVLGPAIVAAVAKQLPHAFFVEIGANDGEQHDHLRPYIVDGAWQGIMVEPVPYVFERLRGNYADADRVALENVAVAATNGVLPFYHLREPEELERASLPSWYDGIGSFSRDFVLGHVHAIPDIAERLVETEVPVLTFETLLNRHRATRVDVLMVDTEGHDAEILRAIDLEQHRPRLIIHEHFHLTRDDRTSAAERLREHGYEVKEEGFDSFSVRIENDDLTRRFRAMRPGIRGVSKAEDERR